MRALWRRRRRRGLFDADGIARLVRADRDGRIDAAYTIFAVVCMELWCGKIAPVIDALKADRKFGLAM